MATFPRLGSRNASVFELKDWLEGQREKARDSLETETDRDKILRTQGRLTLLKELLLNVDSNIRQYGER